MGFLNLFSKPESEGLVRLPSGSFTIDSTGQVIASTLPHSFPATHLHEIARVILWSFKAAQQSGVPINELIVDFAALRLTARELRGGAVIFLNPASITPT